MAKDLLKPQPQKLIKPGGLSQELPQGNTIGMKGQNQRAPLTDIEQSYLKTNRMEEVLKHQGIDPKEAGDDRNSIEKFFNMGQNQGIFKDMLELALRPMKAVQSTITPDEETHHNFFQRFFDGLGGERKLTTAEFLKGAFGIDTEQMDSFGRFVVEFAADMVTDPIVVAPIFGVANPIRKVFAFAGNGTKKVFGPFAEMAMQEFPQIGKMLEHFENIGQTMSGVWKTAFDAWADPEAREILKNISNHQSGTMVTKRTASKFINHMQDQIHAVAKGILDSEVAIRSGLPVEEGAMTAEQIKKLGIDFDEAMKLRESDGPGADLAYVKDKIHRHITGAYESRRKWAANRFQLLSGFSDPDALIKKDITIPTRGTKPGGYIPKGSRFLRFEGADSSNASVMNAIRERVIKELKHQYNVESRVNVEVYTKGATSSLKKTEEVLARQEKTLANMAWSDSGKVELKQKIARSKKQLEKKKARLEELKEQALKRNEEVDATAAELDHYVRVVDYADVKAGVNEARKGRALVVLHNSSTDQDITKFLKPQQAKNIIDKSPADMVGVAALKRVKQTLQTIGGMRTQGEKAILKKFLDGEGIVLDLSLPEHKAMYKYLNETLGKGVKTSEKVANIEKAEGLVVVQKDAQLKKAHVAGVSSAESSARIDEFAAQVEDGKAVLRFKDPQKDVLHIQPVRLKQSPVQIDRLRHAIAELTTYAREFKIPTTKVKDIGYEIMDTVIPGQIALIQAQNYSLANMFNLNIDQLMQDGYLRHVLNPEEKLKLYERSAAAVLVKRKRVGEQFKSSIPSEQALFSFKYRAPIHDINTALGVDFFQTSPIVSLMDQLKVLPNAMEAASIAVEAQKGGLLRTLKEGETIVDEKSGKTILAKELKWDVPGKPQMGTMKYPREFMKVPSSQFKNSLGFLQIIDGANENGVSKFAGLQAMVDSGDDILMHKGLYNQFRRYTNVTQGSLNELVTMVDNALTKPWKKVTTFSVGYHIRNIVTNSINMNLGGMSAVAIAKHMKKAAMNVHRLRDIVKNQIPEAFHNPEIVRGLGDGSLKAEEFIRKAIKSDADIKIFDDYVDLTEKGVLGNTFLSEDLAALLQKTTTTNPVDKNILKELTGQFDEHIFKHSFQFANFMDEAARWAAHDWALTAKGQKVLAENHVWDEAGEKIVSEFKPEDFVKRVMFDFNGMSPFEKTYAKSLLPFYSWMRLNLEFQFTTLMQNPERQAKWQHIWNAGQGMAGTPDSEVPTWLEDAEAWSLGAGQFMNISPPWNEADTLLSSDMLSALHPSIKLLMENITGQDFFTKGKKEKSGVDGIISDIPNLIPATAFMNRSVKAMKRFDDGLLFGFSGGILRHADPAEVRQDKQLRYQSELQDLMREKRKDGQYIPSWEQYVAPQPTATTGRPGYQPTRINIPRTRVRR